MSTEINEKIYAQLSSSQDQTPDTTEPAYVSFNHHDFINGIDHALDKPSDIKITKDGVYTIIAAGQIGRKSGSLLRLCDLWLKVNNKDIPNTGVRCSAPASLFVGDTAVLVTQMVLPLHAGDILNIMLSVSAKHEGLGLIAMKPENQPVIPSIITTIIRI